MALFSDRKDRTDTVTDEDAMPRSTDDDATVVTSDRPRGNQSVVGRAQVDEREAARRRLASPAPSGTVVDTSRTPDWPTISSSRDLGRGPASSRRCR